MEGNALNIALNVPYFMFALLWCLFAPGGILEPFRQVRTTLWLFASPKEKRKAGGLLARRPALKALKIPQNGIILQKSALWQPSITLPICFSQGSKVYLNHLQTKIASLQLSITLLPIHFLPGLQGLTTWWSNLAKIASWQPLITLLPVHFLPRFQGLS